MEISISDEKGTLFIRRWYNKSEVFCISNFNKEDVAFCVDNNLSRLLIQRMSNG